MGTCWPALVAALIALAFSGHLLLTPRPFLGSGTDIVGLEYPLHAFAASRLARGDLPLWNPYHVGGAPFQTGVHGYLSPSFWTTALLEPLFEMKLAIVLHLMLAAGGAAWLAGRRTQSPAAAILAGVVFALSGFAMSHLFAGHRRLFFTAAYLPWVVGLIEEAIRRRPRGVVVAGFVCGLMLLCGHYQVVYIGLLGTGLFVVLEQLGSVGSASFMQRAAKAVVVLAVVAGIGALVAAVQILPMAEALRMSQRSGGGAVFAAGFASAPSNLLTLVWPDLFGNSVEVPFLGSWAYWESLPYLGLVPLLLVAAAPLVLPWRQWLPAGAVVLLGLLLSLGSATPLFGVFVRTVPGADLFRAAGRYVLLVALYGSLLAAQVLGHWSETETAPARRRLAALWVLPLGALGFLLWTGGHSPESWQQLWAGALGGGASLEDMPSQTWGRALNLATWDGGRATVYLGLGAAVLWFGRRPLFRRWAPAALVGLTVLDLYGFGHRFLSTGDRASFVWPEELVGFLERNCRPGDRIMDDPALMGLGRGAAFGVGQVGGYDIFLDDAYARYVNRAEGREPEHYLAIVRVNKSTPMHERLGARYLLTATELGAGENRLRGFDDWAPEGQFGGIWVYRDPHPQPRAFLAHRAEMATEDETYARLADPSFDLTSAVLVERPLPPEFELAGAPANGPRGAPADSLPDAVDIVAYEPDRVEVSVRTSAPGALVLSDNWHPGWRARVDGQQVPVVRVNCVMRAVPVSAGQHDVAYVYRPRTFVIGGIVTVWSLLALAGVGLWGRLARGRKPTLPDQPVEA